MIATLHLLALGGYLVAWAGQVRAFRRELSATGGGWRTALGAWVVHLGGLALFTLRYGSLPLVGLGPASSALAFIVVLFLLAASVREEARASALLVFPVSILLLAEAVLVGIEPAALQTGFRGPWFVAHVVTVFAGYAALILASAAAAMYVLQFRSLKAKRFGSVFRFFPSLDTLDWLNRVGLGVGFPALTVGLVAGWSWTLTYGAGLALGDPQVVLGVITWVAYLGAIAARLNPVWKGSRSALVTAGAFLVTVAAFAYLRVTEGGSGFFL